MSNIESNGAQIDTENFDLAEPDLRDANPAQIGRLFGEASRLIRYVRNRSPYFRAMAILKQYEEHLGALADAYDPPRVKASAAKVD